MNTFSTFDSRLLDNNSKYTWLEVSITVEPETVDAVSETLCRFSRPISKYLQRGGSAGTAGDGVRHESPPATGSAKPSGHHPRRVQWLSVVDDREIALDSSG